MQTSANLSRPLQDAARTSKDQPGENSQSQRASSDLPTSLFGSMRLRPQRQIVRPTFTYTYISAGQRAQSPAVPKPTRILLDIIPRIGPPT